MTASIADFVVSVGSHGHILSQGPLSAVLKLDNYLSINVAREETEVEEVDAVAPDVPTDQDKGKLIVAEEIAVGHIGWDACESLLRLVWMRMLTMLLVKFFFVAMAGSYTVLFWFATLTSCALTELFTIGVNTILFNLSIHLFDQKSLA
jgi:hypothetical protein